jgi:hypothetical protein
MVNAEMKYVVFDGYNGEQIIIFPKIIQHSVMADDVNKSSFGGMRPISGGFVIDGQCVGESESLRMKSRLDKDTALIPHLLDIVEPTEQVAIDELAPKHKSQRTKNQAKRDRKRS